MQQGSGRAGSCASMASTDLAANQPANHPPFLPLSPPMLCCWHATSTTLCGSSEVPNPSLPKYNRTATFPLLLSARAHTRCAWLIEAHEMLPPPALAPPQALGPLSRARQQRLRECRVRYVQRLPPSDMPLICPLVSMLCLCSGCYPQGCQQHTSFAKLWHTLACMLPGSNTTFRCSFACSPAACSFCSLCMVSAVHHNAGLDLQVSSLPPNETPDCWDHCF